MYRLIRARISHEHMSGSTGALGARYWRAPVITYGKMTPAGKHLSIETTERSAPFLRARTSGGPRWVLG